jgi:hypothetical protein
METVDYFDFVNKASELPEGLVVITGPDRNTNSQTVSNIEMCIAERVGPVYRIGNDTGESHPRVIHFKPLEIYVPEQDNASEDSWQEELRQWEQWEQDFRKTVSAHDPAAIIIDGLDVSAPGLANKALRHAMGNTIVVVSVQSHGFQPALETILEASGKGNSNTLAAALEMILFQWPNIDPVSGDYILSSANLDVNKEVRKIIASW